MATTTALSECEKVEYVELKDWPVEDVEKRYCLHNRMPVVLGQGDENEWLDPATSIDTARAMCMPCPSEWLTVVPAT